MELQTALYPIHPTLQLVFDNAEPVEPDVDVAVPMPFRDRFDTLHVTPQNIADTVVEEDGVFRGLSIDGEPYRPTERFLKGLALRMKVPLGVFELFTPLEVIRIMLEVERRYPGLTSRMRECLRSPLPSSKQQDFAFFRLMVENPSDNGRIPLRP